MSNENDDLRLRLRKSFNRGEAPELSAGLVVGAAGRPTPRLANPARTLRIAGAAGVAIAAVTVGALVLGPSMTRAPLFTAASPASASALGSSDANSSDAKMMAIWAEYQYSASSSLSTEGGSGPVYQLVLDAADPKARTAELARVFGIDEVVTKADYADSVYPTWVVGPQDGSNVNLTYSAYGTGDWWFNDPTVASVYLCDPSVTSVDAASQGCTLPSEAPANRAPTGDAARSAAKALFASTGYKSTAADIEITSGIDGTSASAYLTVEGIKTGLSWGAYWVNTGELSYAYGHSVRPEARGTFSTVSPTDAVQRLADYRWYGSAGPEYQGGAMMFATKGAGDDGPATVNGSSGSTDAGTQPAIPPTDDLNAPVATPTGGATDTPTDGATVTPTDGATDGSIDPSTPVPDESLPPVEVEPTPAVVEVTVDKAVATLLLMWDANGNAWLVPGYAMQMPEGWWSAVVGLVDGVIALPERM